MVKTQSKECFPSGGAIFLCNRQTRRECFEKKIFGLSPSFAEFVECVKAGTTLFLLDIDQHKLHGVFEATSDGALDIIPDAYISAGQRFPYQIRFKRIWFCKPLMEGEFQDAMQNSFVIRNKFTYHLSHQQVTKLLHLFSSRKRLQPPQNPRPQEIRMTREFGISSLVKETDMQPSPNCNSCGPCSTSRSHILSDPGPLVHRVLQSDVSDISKSNSTISSLHTGADPAIFTIPSNQEAICDQATDDFIPLSQEEDVFEGVDDLFALPEDENHSSESKGSSDSEDCNSFRQSCVRKKDGCHPLMVDSKLRSDMERRKSVFSRIVRTDVNQRKRSKAKVFPQRSIECFDPFYQTKKQRRAQQNKSFPCQNDGMVHKPSADGLRGVGALDNSFVCSDNRRSTKFSVRAEDRNNWDESSKEPVRDDTCRKPFVPKGSAKWDESCDKGLNAP